MAVKYIFSVLLISSINCFCQKRPYSTLTFPSSEYVDLPRCPSPPPRTACTRSSTPHQIVDVCTHSHSTSSFCACTKTILKPQMVQQIINVPLVQDFVETLASPVLETINYEATPVNCPLGPIKCQMPPNIRPSGLPTFKNNALGCHACQFLQCGSINSNNPQRLKSCQSGYIISSSNPVNGPSVTACGPCRPPCASCCDNTNLINIPLESVTCTGCPTGSGSNKGLFELPNCHSGSMNCLQRSNKDQSIQCQSEPIICPSTCFCHSSGCNNCPSGTNNCLTECSCRSSGCNYCPPGSYNGLTGCSCRSPEYNSNSPSIGVNNLSGCNSYPSTIPQRLTASTTGQNTIHKKNFCCNCMINGKHFNCDNLLSDGLMALAELIRIKN